MEEKLKIVSQRFRTNVQIIRLKLEDGLARLPLFVFSKGRNRQRTLEGTICDTANKVIAEGVDAHNDKFILEAAPGVGMVPGELAYKIDRHIDQLTHSDKFKTIFVNGKPRSCLFLGSHRTLAADVHCNSSAQEISNALQQLASVTYVEKKQKNLNDGVVKEQKLIFHKFQVAEESYKLQDIDGNDTVINKYITQNKIVILIDDMYLNFLSGKKLRPINSRYILDVDMPGISARFYEIVSKEIFTTIKFQKQTVSFGYNELCRLIPQKRHTAPYEINRQMCRVVKVHLETGYLASFRVKTKADGIDHEMIFTPGPLAYEEYNFFNQSAKRELPDSSVVLIGDSRNGAGSTAEQSDVVPVEATIIEATRMAQVESKPLNSNQPHPQDIKASQAQPRTLTGEVEVLLIKEGVGRGSKKLKEILKRVASGELTRSVVEELIGYCRWAKQTGVVTKGYAGFLVTACEAGPSFISDEYRAGQQATQQPTSTTQQQAEAKTRRRSWEDEQREKQQQEKLVIDVHAKRTNLADALLKSGKYGDIDARRSAIESNLANMRDTVSAENFTKVIRCRLQDAVLMEFLNQQKQVALLKILAGSIDDRSIRELEEVGSALENLFVRV